MLQYLQDAVQVTAVSHINQSYLCIPPVRYQSLDLLLIRLIRVDIIYFIGGFGRKIAKDVMDSLDGIVFYKVGSLAEIFM